MIVRELKDVIGSWRHASGDGWESRRIVLADDRMGCSLHDTLVREGAELHLEYKNHLEVNYCIEGEGEVVDVATGTIWPIRPGTMYALDKHDPAYSARHQGRPAACMHLFAGFVGPRNP